MRQSLLYWGDAASPENPFNDHPTPPRLPHNPQTPGSQRVTGRARKEPPSLLLCALFCFKLYTSLHPSLLLTVCHHFQVSTSIHTSISSLDVRSNKISMNIELFHKHGSKDGLLGSMDQRMLIGDET